MLEVGQLWRGRKERNIDIFIIITKLDFKKITYTHIYQQTVLTIGPADISIQEFEENLKRDWRLIV